MKKRLFLLLTLTALLSVCLAMKPARFQVKREEGNVVSSRLEGKWQLYVLLTKRLFGEDYQLSLASSGRYVSFKSDSSVVEKIPDKYEKFLHDKTIYMAGTMKLRGKDFPFILIELIGNPHIVYFRERDGDPMGDAESFNVMLAPAKDKANDLLFIGGDFNNQPFSAYERIKDVTNLIEGSNDLSFASKEQRELLRYYDGSEKIPHQLYQVYAQLVKAIEAGSQANTNEFCLPHSVTYTAKERPKRSRGYGHNMNIPFLKKGFDKYIRNLRNEPQDCYLIRTGSTAMWFINTDKWGWKLYRYLDKPIK